MLLLFNIFRSVSPSSSNTDISISPGCEDYNTTNRTGPDVTFEKWKYFPVGYSKFPTSSTSQSMSAFHHPQYPGNSQVIFVVLSQHKTKFIATNPIL